MAVPLGVCRSWGHRVLNLFEDGHGRSMTAGAAEGSHRLWFLGWTWAGPSRLGGALLGLHRGMGSSTQLGLARPWGARSGLVPCMYPQRRDVKGATAHRCHALCAGYHKWTHSLFAAYTLEPRPDHNAGAAANATPLDSTTAATTPSASKAAATAALLRTARLALTQQQLLQPMREAAKAAAAAAAASAAAGPSSTPATSAATETGTVPSSGSVGEAKQYDKPPIVVLHGLGIGLLPYQRLLDELAAACPDRRLVVLEYKHVAMRLTTQVPRWASQAQERCARTCSQCSVRL